MTSTPGVPISRARGFSPEPSPFRTGKNADTNLFRLKGEE